MKKILFIAGCVIAGIVIGGCGARRSPGHSYMPDMTYSVAYETYAPTEERLAESGARYTAKPVEGTIARGDFFPYTLKNDSVGYAQSAFVKNPLDPATIDMTEAQRLYLVNCAICHGSKLDGNGPLWKDGSGPFTSAPKNFMDNEMKAMPEGTMFHSATYGKNMMGSYASQLDTKQRWMVIAYIKSKQAGGANKPDSTGANKPTAPDTAKTAAK